MSECCPECGHGHVTLYIRARDYPDEWGRAQVLRCPSCREYWTDRSQYGPEVHDLVQSGEEDE
jgi:hypothetical protein